jgi:hypothetical protein
MMVLSGHNDCSDGSDEDHCQINDDDDDNAIGLFVHRDSTCMYGYRCIQRRLVLDEIKPLCLSLNQLCDGIRQCPMGDDEHQWRCRK